MTRRSITLAIVLLAAVVGTTAFVVARDGGKAPESTNRCLRLSLQPTPVAGAEFEAAVRPRPGCRDQGELLGGPAVALWDGDRRVGYLVSPDKIVPPDNTDWSGVGHAVDRPLPFRMPRLSDGRYTLCSEFSIGSTADRPDRSCASFVIAR